MKRIGVVVSLAFIACASFAQVYKWTDSQGVIHFSDTPHSGAETIDTIQTQSYSSPASSSSVTSIQNSSPIKKQEAYTKLAITQPTDQATIRNNQGYVVVTIEIEPQLLPGNSIQILFDGKAQGTPQSSLMFQLNGIYRGSHTIAVQILDTNGEVLKTSPPVTIFMHRPRVGMVKNPAR
jgi:hypothetical protein